MRAGVLEGARRATGNTPARAAARRRRGYVEGQGGRSGERRSGAPAEDAVERASAEGAGATPAQNDQVPTDAAPRARTGDVACAVFHEWPARVEFRSAFHDRWNRPDDVTTAPAAIARCSSAAPATAASAIAPASVRGRRVSARNARPDDVTRPLREAAALMPRGRAATGLDARK